MPRFRQFGEVPFRTVEAWQVGHHNPSTLIKVDGDPQADLFRGARGAHYLATACGSGDDLSVFQRGAGEDAVVFVLAVNRGLPYLGVESFCLADDASDEWERVSDRTPIRAIPAADSLFYQGDEQVEDALGGRWEHLGGREIVERLEDRL